MADLMAKTETMIKEMRAARAPRVAAFVEKVPAMLYATVSELASRHNTTAANGVSMTIPSDMAGDAQDIADILNRTYPSWKFDARRENSYTSTIIARVRP